jgi:predicted 3-demethylubiquinone-9 3-methyltransferase (glyoxalase superfamily)
VNFYVSLFPNSKIVTSMGIAVDFILDGVEFLALDGRDSAGFNSSSSFVITCDSQEIIDKYWNALTSDGGSEGRCGWCVDKFGVHWQVVPRNLSKLLGGSDAEASKRAMGCMMKSKKFVIADLEAARKGPEA